jgi:hypothetical protein
MNLLEYLNARAVRNANLDLLIGRTQRSLSNGTLLVIAGVIYAIFQVREIDQLVKEILIFILGGLLNNWATQNGFWYGRPRGAGIPDPSLTETKITEKKTIETETKTAAAPIIPAEPVAPTPAKPPGG